MAATEGQELAPRRAVIDIGSNTVRLVVYGGPPRAPVVLLNEKVTARLGKGVGENGRISAKAAAAALAGLHRFRALVSALDLPDEALDVVATAAARDARNGAEFLAAVRSIGFAPRLLSGEEEAIASAHGVMGAFPEAHGVVADLGGGSLELIDIDGKTCRHGVSLQLGTLRLPAMRAAGPRAFSRTVSEALDAEDWAATPESTLYLVGGSFRSIARYALAKDGGPCDDPHGFTMPAAEAARLAGQLRRTPADRLLSVPGLSSSRTASLPDAAALLAVLVRVLHPREVVFSSWGLREGVLFGTLSAAEQAQDPLIAGISAFARRHGADPQTATMVAGWSAPVACGADERLRLAATMLALASASLEPNLRARHAADWALRKRWIGLWAKDRALLAAAVVANAGRGDLDPQIAAAADPAVLAEAQGWGLAVRLCRRFSGCSPAVLAGSRLEAGEGVLRLRVEPALAPLVGDGVERDLRALGAHLGLRAEWTVA